MTSSIQPGTVLGGRYQLADLLEDVDGARLWRAGDVVLERPVMAYVVPEDDPRAPAMLAAARHSATVTDPHLLRVLDADTGGGLTWVVVEWGAGESLDLMIGHQTLAPDRAAWLVREVAAAIDVAHRHGLTHGRLAPENVMVTESGTVRLIGFAVDATLQRGQLRSGNYPGCTPLEADLFDLAGLLYAALVGRWPGASGSHVPAAPRDGNGPLRPRQVRAGVPRELDAICGRILSRSHPDRTAHQLSAVLTEYIGELAVADPAIAAVALPETDSSLDDLAAATGTSGSRTRPTDQPLVPATPGDTTTPLVAAEPVQAEHDEPAADPGDATVIWSRDDADEQEWAEQPAPDAEDEDEPPDEPDATGSLPDEDTQVGEPPGRDLEEAAGLDTDWHRPTAEPAPPAPPLEPVPERPLFAPEGARRQARGEVPRSATASWGTEVAPPPPPPPADVEETGSGWSMFDTGGVPAQRRPQWPLGEDDPDAVVDDWEERTRRPWLRLPLVITVLVVVAILVVAGIAFWGKPNLDVPGRTQSTPAPSQPASGQAIRIRSAQDIDPYAVPPEENPDEAGRAIDRDPRSSWDTVTYRGRPDLGGLKPGVGLVLDLGAIRRVGSVDLRLVGAPTSLTIYAAPTSSGEPTGIEGLRRVGARTDAGERATVRLAQPVRTRYVVVWLTSLPKVDDGFRGGIANVTVRS